MDAQRKNKWICILSALFLAVGFLSCLFLPKEEYSISERRKLAVMPKLSPGTVWSGRFMSDFETYAVDRFPFRDSFRMGKAMTAAYVFLRQDNNGIYRADGHLSSVEYPLKEASVEGAMERFRSICEKYLTEENQVFLSVVPDKNCFLAKESGHLSMDYGDFEKKVEKAADFAQYISISELLERDDYYRTDTHWRQERITDVAKRLAESMDAMLLEEYELHTLGRDFYGVYYGQSALPFAPDTLEYLTGEAINHCTVYDWQNNRDISVYDQEKAKGPDPYEMFLSGSLSLITIENPVAKTQKELVLFRDSFGSSLAPLLVSGYAKITLVDIRYIQPDYLGQFVDFEGCDVLFLYSTLVLNNSETLK